MKALFYRVVESYWFHSLQVRLGALDQSVYCDRCRRMEERSKRHPSPGRRW